MDAICVLTEVFFMNKKTACFTGHRNILDKDLTMLTKKLDETIESLIEQGIIFYGAGGAVG